MRTTSSRSKRNVREPPKLRRSSNSIVPFLTDSNSPWTREPLRKMSVSALRLTGSARIRAARASQRWETICNLLRTVVLE